MVLTSIFSYKAIIAVFAVGTAMLAVGEANSNQTLIIVAVITMVGTLFTGIITLISARISANNARQLAPLATLPGKVDEFKKEIDGRLTELKESRQETSDAKVEAAHLGGQLEERGRQEEKK